MTYSEELRRVRDSLQGPQRMLAAYEYTDLLSGENPRQIFYDTFNQSKNFCLKNIDMFPSPDPLLASKRSGRYRPSA